MSADVFVDRTGRRRRLLGWVAVTSAALLLGALGLLAAGLVAGSPLPLTGWTVGNGGATPEPESAVIGPAPPAPAAPTTKPGAEPTSGSRSATAPNATPNPTDRPGKGVGRDNRPTERPDHPQPKSS
ncbi:hypothetical protein [Asanoa iriomotensis]|uniref:Uncharacterized protein n=1 Tax=Asanoa iriomotensis TaxID=234613 RepID=A0ABQ4C2H7_9ACTN|nr:hypothetical protein [Asanoa iriomotensis]GIF56500.1 hypothetical protein Air01nite_25950 [Asanoa iriomotensis]